MGADSLHFITVDGVYRAMGYTNGRDNSNPQFTDHCFTGDYPTDLVDLDNKLGNEQATDLTHIKV